MTPNVELKQIVSLLESSDARQGLAYEHAGDTHRLSSTSDLAHLAALAALLNHASPSVVAYGLKSIRRIGGNLDEYLEAICGCTQVNKRRGFCDEIEAAGINGEVAAIIHQSILEGSLVARRCGVRLVERKAIGWFDRMKIRWLMRRDPSSQRPQ